MQQEIQLDIYYQGSQTQLLSLLYPLHSPNSPQFTNLDLTSISYQPKQQSLSMTYLPTSIPNTNQISKQITYKSRKIDNRTNYFYSILNEDKKSVVWRSINSFLQMRPTQEAPYKPVAETKHTLGMYQRKYQSYDQVMSTLASEPKKELKYCGVDDLGNKVHENMRNATKGALNKIGWKYTKDQYRRCLSK